MPTETAPHRNPAPPRPSKEAPKEPTTLPELEEAVRERLHQHGQHGALALFGKYTAEVAKVAELARGRVVSSTPVGSAGTADGKVEAPPAGDQPVGANQKAKRASKAKK